MLTITNIALYKILDGNGYFTAELKFTLSNKAVITASAPFDYTTLYEAEHHSSQAKKIIDQAQTLIVPQLTGLEVDEAFGLTVDQMLGELRAATPRLDKNATFLFSLAANRAAALAGRQELYRGLNQSYQFGQTIFQLPTPIFNMFNGGKFGDTNLDFEEFLLLPLTKSKTSFLEKVECGAAIWHALAAELKAAGFDTDLGSEGGFAPDISSSVQAMELIAAACRRAGYKLNEEVGLGLDVGANWLVAPDGGYLFRLDHNHLSSLNLAHLYEEWVSRYHLLYLEDPLAASDRAGWQELGANLRHSLMLAGDELFANSCSKLRQNLKEPTANTVVVRLDNAATVSELVEFIKLAKTHHYQVVLSAGYSETNDTFVVDLAVAAGADFIKSGSLARGERNDKYNRLLELEQNLLIAG